MTPLARMTTSTMQSREGKIGATKSGSKHKKRHFGPARKGYENDYTGLATLMVENPEKAIVRRFATLNMKMALYMQAELADLEEQLETQIEYDKQYQDTEPYSRSWFWLEHGEEVFEQEEEENPENVELQPREQPGDAQKRPKPTSIYEGDLSASQVEPNTDNNPSELPPRFVPPDNPTSELSLSRERVFSEMRPEDGKNSNLGSEQRRNTSKTVVASDPPHVQPVEQKLLHNNQPGVQRKLVYEIKDKLEKYSELCLRALPFEVMANLSQMLL